MDTPNAHPQLARPQASQKDGRIPASWGGLKPNQEHKATGRLLFSQYASKKKKLSIKCTSYSFLRKNLFYLFLETCFLLKYLANVQIC